MPAAHPFADLDAIYIINLDTRRDRLELMRKELMQLGLPLENSNVIRVSASRPSDKGKFPSIGVHGCFMSHLKTLEMAQEQGHQTVLVFEDDALLTNRLNRAREMISDHLNRPDWDMTYLGFGWTHGQGPELEGWADVAPDESLILAHAILWRRPAIDIVVPYLKAMLEREAGDPKGGPMHVDGAIAWARRDHPEIKAMRAGKAFVFQRSSDSDIAQAKVYNKWNVIGLGRKLKDLRRRWA